MKIRKAKRSLSSLLAMVLLTIGGTLFAQDDPIITPAEAREYIGEIAMVCGKVVGATYAQGTRGRPTYLNFGKPYPDSVFTAIIWGDDRDEFDYRPETLEGQQVCVYGMISRYRNKPQMKIAIPEQIGFRGKQQAESSDPP